MFKRKKLFFMSAFFVLFPVFHSHLFAETLTLSTYYPAPEGRYDEMRANRMAVGATYVGSATTVPDDSLIVSGNVGFGVENPLFVLHVAGGQVMAQDGLYVSGVPGNCQIAFRGIANDVSTELNAIKMDNAGASPKNDMQFFTNGSETMRLTTGGNLGIGVMAPTRKLQVNGIGYFTGGLIAESATGAIKFFPSDLLGNVAMEMRSTAPNMPYIDFSNDAVIDYDMRLVLANNNLLTLQGGDFQVDGSAFKSGGGAWAATSDRRIKTEINDSEGLTLLMKLRPVKFKYTDEYKKEHVFLTGDFYYSFIAQEYRDVFPQSVKKTAEYLKDDKENPILAIDPFSSQIVTVKAVQEQQQQIQQQQSVIVDLQRRLEVLESGK